jgi:hypothetical protein
VVAISRSAFFARLICLVGIGPCLSGCLASFSSPERLYPVNVEMAALRSQPDLIPDFKYYANLSSDVPRVLYRNGLIEARLRAIDIQYSVYEEALTEERQASELLAGAATIALTGTSALISPVATKDILTQVAGGITGINGVFNDKVLLSKTIQVLEHQMRAERDRVSAKIYAGMRLSSIDYSLSMGLADTEDYYRAGTLAGALIDINQTVSREAAAAKASKDTFVVSYGFAADDAANLIRLYVWPGGKLNPDRQKNIQALLKQLGNPAPLGIVLRNPEFIETRNSLRILAGKAGYF